MSAQSLNVRVGLIFDKKSLAGIERSMKSAGQRLSRIGTDLSLSLSLPLAAFGVTAIKAAGDIESLTLALKSQLGTADAAAKELDKLTEAAKNPGLGLEQAVRGSVRLQGVAFSADEARNVLVQMGNAIASTGGSAQELDAVTRQFAQMTSKGRVLQEDVSVLSENMPGLAQLMQKAFGTASVEAIRDMGITGKEFVLQITKAAEALPRVEGGIKNGIGNAIDSLKQSAAKVGFAINEAFDVTGIIENVSTSVLALAEAFNSLSPAAKEVALVLAATVIAAGPLLKIYGALKLFGGQMVGVWGDMVGAGKALAGTSDAMAGALTRVKVALGIIGIVAGLAFAVYQLSDNFDAATFASEQYAKAQGDIISETSKEIGEVNKLFAAVTDETKSKFEKGQSIDKLLKLYPDYFKGMDLEGASVSKLTELQNGLNSSILRGVAERKKAEAVNSIYEKQAAILLRIQQIKDGAKVTPGEANLIDTGEMIAAGGIAEGVMKKMEEQAKELGKQVGVVSGQFDKAFGTIGTTLDPAIAKQYELRDAYEAEKEAHQQGLLFTKEATKATTDLTLTKSEQNKALKEANKLKKDAADLEAESIARGEAEIKMLREIQDAWRDEAAAIEETMAARALAGTAMDATSLAPGGEQGLSLAPQPMATDVAPGITAGTNALYAYSEAALYASEIQRQLNEDTFNFTTGMADVATKLLEQGDLVGAVFTSMGDAIAQSASSGEASLAKLGQAAVGAAAKIVRSYIQQGVAAAVAKALSGVPFPFNLAAGAAAGGAAAALFTHVIGSLGVKGFADGTKNAPGGLALVGERGPELINLPRHSQVFPTPQTNSMLNNMGGDTTIVGGTVHFDGRDMYLMIEKQNQNAKRTRGYGLT